jgi:S1-C subfamily serine protease
MNRVALAAATVALAAAVLSCALPGVTAPPPTLAPAPTPTLPPSAPPSVADSAAALEEQVVAVYERAAPAVVNITTRVIAYDFFMRPVPQEGGTGSGFLYDAEGHIVTNYHVVEQAESVSVSLASGEVFPAEIVGVDPSTDLAVLQIDTDGLPQPIPLADSGQLRVGQFVLAIGSPFRQEGSLTVGVISALGRVIESPDRRFIGEVIQTDAAINPGNSGGPLLDLHGRVIGVNSQIISPSGTSAGIGFAVSSNTVQRVVPELIAGGRYPHPWIGIELASFEAEGAQILRDAGMEVPVDEGVLVTAVVPGSPAAAAGIRGSDREVQIGTARVPIGGDIIIAINGQSTTSSQELIVFLESETRVGETAVVALIRNGAEIAVTVTLAERPGGP